MWSLTPAARWTLNNGGKGQKWVFAGANIARITVDSVESSHGITTFGGYVLSDYARGVLQNATNRLRSAGLDISVIMVDLTTGQGVARNPYGTFYGASTIKGVYVPSVIAQNESRAWSYEYLMQPTIYNSGNNAYSQLRNIFGAGPINAWCDEAGYHATDDAGIVFAGSRPYALAILSNSPSNFGYISPVVQALDVVHQDMVG